MNGIKAYWFGVLGVGFFVGSTILAGFQIPGYSHISQLISESYAIGTPYGFQLRYFGFMPSGIFLAAFSFFAMKTLPKSRLTKIGFFNIGLFYGIATMLVSLFPCDKGCGKELINPSLSQLIHNLTGLLTYIIVPVSVLILGVAARKWENGKKLSNIGMLCGGVSIFFVGILSDDLHTRFAGLYQRIIEGSILVWIIVCSFYQRTFEKK